MEYFFSATILYGSASAKKTSVSCDGILELKGKVANHLEALDQAKEFAAKMYKENSKDPSLEVFGVTLNAFNALPKFEHPL